MGRVHEYCGVKDTRKISSTTIEGWVGKLTEAFYDSVETLSSATALDLQESAGVPHLVGKIIVQTAQAMNDLTESEASKTSDAKVEVRTSQKKCGGSSDELIDYEDDEEIIIPVIKAKAPAEGVKASLEKVQMPIGDGSMEGPGVLLYFCHFWGGILAIFPHPIAPCARAFKLDAPTRPGPAAAGHPVPL